jgi:hypothetical protein
MTSEEWLGPQNSKAMLYRYITLKRTLQEIYRIHIKKKKKTQLNSIVWVREWTIPTERPPLVGEVTANFCGKRVPRGQRYGTLRPYSRFSRQEPLLFYQVAPQLYSRGWVHPIPDPLFFLVVPGIEPGPPDLLPRIWPLDHRGSSEYITIQYKFYIAD